MAGRHPHEIIFAQTGRIWAAPVGTAEPADAATAPSIAWLDLGYTTEDGVTLTFDKSVKEIMGWQSRDPLRIIIENEPKMIGFELMQNNPITMSYALGGGAWTEPTTGNALFTPPTPGVVDERAMIVELVDGTSVFRFHFRKTMQQASVALKGVRADASTLPIEASVLAPPAGVTDAYIIHTNAPAFTA